ncbi:MAG: hypothetical protein ISN28_10810 [Ectothiorhodospiraceae bacterium AqS1]|nr:hypothetical protein [Ectothiorhodospiraceae bacterium AqS1]
MSLTIDDPEGRCASAVAGITDETACPITVSPDELTFTSVNYGTAQPVTVTSRYDNDDQDEEDIVITIAATEGMTAEAVTKEIKVEEPEVDPDKQINNLPDGAIVVSPSGAINLDEGGIGADIEVSIDTQPTSTVTVSILSSDSHVAVFPTSLTFDAYGWNKDTDKQKVTLSTRQDANDVDDEVTITFVATGGIDAMPFEKKVNVKDTVSGSELIVYPNGALHIGEGGTGVLSVKLGSQPAADTTVSLSNANDDITLHEVDDERFQSTLSSLAFTPSNWNDPQTFIVRAKADADAENDRDTIVIAADGFSDRRIDVLVTDGNDDLPVRAYALAIPPDSAQDNSTVRVHCKEDTPCQVMLDCNAQNDGSSFEGWIPRIIPAHGGMTLSTADIKRYTGASWSGKGRLGCALRSEQRISAQVWTRSGDGVLVNNSAALRSVPEGSGYRVDIESISSPDTREESNLRIRCLAPDAQDCVEMRLSCYSDDGTMHHDGSINVDRLAVRHLQSEELAGMIGHRWLGMGLACEIYSDHPFTVQVLTRTGGGGALVNNSAIGRRDR